MRRTFLALLIAVVSAGCNPKGATGPALPEISVFKPDALFSGKAVLEYGGMKAPVTMRRTEASDRISFSLIAHGQTFETETYRLTESEFAFVSIDEAFDPPVTLFKSKMPIGETWEWKGTLSSGGRTHEAKAVVTTSSEQLFLGAAGQQDTLKVIVSLSIESGGPKPAARQLVFWFVNGRGIVQREVGTATIRRPEP